MPRQQNSAIIMWLYGGMKTRSRHSAKATMKKASSDSYSGGVNVAA